MGTETGTGTHVGTGTHRGTHTGTGTCRTALEVECCIYFSSHESVAYLLRTACAASCRLPSERVCVAAGVSCGEL